jgi:F0F1-type ATP synthase membrane subunit b/b'
VTKCRLLLPFFALLFLAQGLALAGQSAQQRSSSGEGANGNWEIANFAIFAAGLGWFVARKGPRFFAARSADIQKAIRDATGLKMDADLRYSESDRKMASLAEAIKQMRDQSALEMQKVQQQMLEQTGQQSDRIRQSALTEIQSLEAEGRRRVKRYMAGLTLSLVEKRLQEQSPDRSGEEMLHEFLNLVQQTNN